MNAKKIAVRSSFVCLLLLSATARVGAQPSCRGEEWGIGIRRSAAGVPSRNTRRSSTAATTTRLASRPRHHRLSHVRPHRGRRSGDARPTRASLRRRATCTCSCAPSIRIRTASSALLSRRDVKTASDQIKLMIDSYHDRRTGYEFAVNPAGVKRDYLHLRRQPGRRVVGRRLGRGHAHRLAGLDGGVPHSAQPAALRAGGGAHLRRDDRPRHRAAQRARRAGRCCAARSPASRRSSATSAALRDSTSPRRLEVTPYALTRNSVHCKQRRVTRARSRRRHGRRLKYGLTSNLTLDATVNPDFGQVEADPATAQPHRVRDLLRRATPLLPRGHGHLSSSATIRRRLFYSRRIGRAPQLAGLVTDETSTSRAHRASSAPASSPAGSPTARRSACSAPCTERTEAGEHDHRAATTYGMLRATRDFRGGESALGFVATVVDRRIGCHERGLSPTERIRRGHGRPPSLCRRTIRVGRIVFGKRGSRYHGRHRAHGAEWRARVSAPRRRAAGGLEPHRLTGTRSDSPPGKCRG